ncbi:PEPxxWA-CTERM sorting domain-containing protein (plasmid) [Polymorphobacter megasporae]|nr:PEPxxWA-CTERM sorting domain-containing protein [Polymorphobacter megasporae]
MSGGNYPIVEILNGALAGVGNIFINAAGYSLDADPIADAFGGFDLGSGNGGFDFFLGKSIGGDPFAKTLAVGNFDASSAVTAAVPEPSTWALMIGGFGLAGGALRRRTYVVP